MRIKKEHGRLTGGAIGDEEDMEMNRGGHLQCLFVLKSIPSQAWNRFKLKETKTEAYLGSEGSVVGRCILFAPPKQTHRTKMRHVVGVALALFFRAIFDDMATGGVRTSLGRMRHEPRLALAGVNWVCQKKQNFPSIC
jgi:hypothetical protein